MLIYTLQRAHIPFHHDSLYYWELGGSFYSNDRFSLLNFGDGLRGYLFPFLLYLVQIQAGLFGADARVLFAVYSAMAFSVFAMCIVPWSFGTIFRWKTNTLSRILFALLLFLFWRGHFVYPLTDFPAFASLLMGVTMLVEVLRDQKRFLWLAIAGFFAAAAINIRPAYQISILIVFVSSLVGLGKIGIRRLSLALLLFCLGCGGALFPQVLINREHFKSNSPLVLAKYLDESTIYEVQLFWGLKTQKYETNIGEGYPFAGVVYSDPLALKLPRKESHKKTFPNYLRIVSQIPLDLAISYFRHAFNGLDIFHPTPYVRNVFADHFLFSLANYVIWFLLLYRVLHSNSPNPDSVNLVVVSGMLAPVLLAIPTVVEVRFFLPAYILAYAVISFGFDFKELTVSFMENRWHLLRFLVLCLSWIMICFTLSAGTMEQLVR